MVHLVPCSHSGAPCDRDHTFHLGRGRPITLSWQVGEKEAIAAAAAWEGGATPLTIYVYIYIYIHIDVDEYIIYTRVVYIINIIKYTSSMKYTKHMIQIELNRYANYIILHIWDINNKQKSPNRRGPNKQSSGSPNDLGTATNCVGTSVVLGGAGTNKTW